MPCYDDRNDPANVRADTVKKFEGKLSKLQERNDELARLLCTTCRNLEEIGKSYLLPVKVSIWWIAHKKCDAMKVKTKKQGF